MGQWFIILAIILALLFILMYNIINQNEDKVLFYPSKKRVWEPKIPHKTVYLNINSSEVCYSPKEKKKNKNYIECWHFDNFKNEKTVCFFHGNSGNITNRSYIINLCYKFKMNLFLCDYSGFGDSSGFPHKTLLRENADTIYDYLHKIVSDKDLIVWAESLGCLPASYLCSKHELGGLIVLCGFSSLDDIFVYQTKGYQRTGAKFLTNILSYKMDFLPVKDYLYYVKSPVVFIHSKDDTLIPYKCSKINYKHVNHPNKLHVTIEGDHSSPKISTKQLRQIFQFCNLPDENLTSGSISYMLKDLETFAERNNNFIYSK